MMPTKKSRSELADTDLCVMCGMCLPHCPTYQLYQTEAESPRGRIALMQSIDQARLEADPVALEHIDHCLGCLNCQTICPSRVPYGSLIDEFRHQYHEQIPKPRMSQEVLRLSMQDGQLEKLGRLANQPVIRPLINLGQWLLKTPIPQGTSAQLAEHYPAAGECHGQVTLFTGCSTQSMDGQTLLDTIALLTHLGYDVAIPPIQPCCGALHQHNGEKAEAEILGQRQEALLEKSRDSRAILFFSPACGSRLREISSERFVDVRDFILQHHNSNPLSLAAQETSVALHESCSNRNMLKAGNLNRELLALIPGLQIQPSSQPSLCCGAGGLQAINYPAQAHALGIQKLKSFDFTQAKTLLSDNIGCSLHMKSLLSGYNPEIEVLHPISLIKRQLLDA